MLAWIAGHVPLVRMLSTLGGALAAAMLARAALQRRGRHRKGLLARHAMPHEMRRHGSRTATYPGAVSLCSAQRRGEAIDGVVRDEHPTPHGVPADDSPTVVLEPIGAAA